MTILSGCFSSVKSSSDFQFDLKNWKSHLASGAFILMRMRSLTYGELIRTNRNFRNLLAGQFISELGNWFNFIAGLGLVRLVSDASPTAAGIFFVARLLPFALMSPIAGTFVDRFSRRTVMIATDISRAV